MGWFLVFLVWWCGASAIPSPAADKNDNWKCPRIVKQPIVECSCDMPHTLRCMGDRRAIPIISWTLRSLNTASVSLSDCTIQNLTVITNPLLEGVSSHGLVISSGELREVDQVAFQGSKSPLQALGSPNNQLPAVPTAALRLLQDLERLDLSSNRIKGSDTNSFKGLKNSSFIDLSNNVISKIAPSTFNKLLLSKVLRSKGNRIKLTNILKLSSMPNIEDLDLSENLLLGPLGPKTFPKMDSLKDLQSSHNSISSIKLGALEGLTNLQSLSIHHNQIDVVEDHAFSQLFKLTSSDLSNNRIVAVSGASSAHLGRLKEINLSNNYSRALTADLVSPLKSSRTLKSDDNDISIVAGDASKNITILKELSLADNPLNCDCSLEDFSHWSTNSASSRKDKESAVCATPPSLENGLLVELSSENSICGHEEPENADSPTVTSPMKNQISIKDFKYDGRTVDSIWKIEEDGIPYTCEAIYVYEQQGLSEISIESTPLKCNSSEMNDPTSSEISVPGLIDLQRRHKYRYCLVLLQNGETDDVSLILGCSDILPLVQNVQNEPLVQYPKVTSLLGNLSSSGNLVVKVDVYPETKCEVYLGIFEQGLLISEKNLNCSYPQYSFEGLTNGPYRACASIVHPGLPPENYKKRCINVFRIENMVVSGVDLAMLSILIIFCFVLLSFIWGLRKILLKTKLQTHQCYISPEMESDQSNQYVKLQATTKV